MAHLDLAGMRPMYHELLKDYSLSAAVDHSNPEKSRPAVVVVWQATDDDMGDLFVIGEVKS